MSLPKTIQHDVQKEMIRQHNQERELALETLREGRSTRYFVDNFSKYALRQEISYFLARHELFKKILDRRGCIVECGVAEGAGLLAWAQLSAIHEPLGVWRHIYGFDTFAGFPSVHENDLAGSGGQTWKPGDLHHSVYEELHHCIELLDRSPYPPKFPKVQLIKGDFMLTGEQFLQDNPHTLISLLFLDFDLYEPTKKALQIFLPRMPKGSVLAFDQLNHPRWPGETLAFLETMNVRTTELHTLPYTERISYVVL
jgi:hypothetical protein